MTIKIQPLCEDASRYPYQKPIGIINHYSTADKKEYVHRPGLMERGEFKNRGIKERRGRVNLTTPGVDSALFI
jgi:hypothetical protein